MSPTTLSRIIRCARQRAFDRPNDPDRCGRIIDKVRSRCPRFTPSPRLARLEAEREARFMKADGVGYMGIVRGEDRAFRSHRAAMDKFIAWEGKHLLPLRAAELKAWRALPEVLPYHVAGIV